APISELGFFWQRKDLQLAGLVVAKIAVVEYQPDATGRVGRDAPHQRNPLRSKFLLNAQVADSDQLAVRRTDIGAHPDVVLPIFCDRRDHAEATAIEPVDDMELAAVEHGQPGPNAGPESSRMILPERVHPAARDWNRHHVVPTYRVQTLCAGDPDGAIVRR